MQTLCHALDTHPQKADLEIVLLPLSIEYIFSFENVPIPAFMLREYFQQMVIDDFGFKSIDYSVLGHDSLFFMRQLEIQPEFKDHYLKVCDPMKDGDLVPAFLELFIQRVNQGIKGKETMILEPNEAVYERALKLRQQLMQIIRETEERTAN